MLNTLANRDRYTFRFPIKNYFQLLHSQLFLLYQIFTVICIIYAYIMQQRYNRFTWFHNENGHCNYYTYTVVSMYILMYV